MGGLATFTCRNAATVHVHACRQVILSPVIVAHVKINNICMTHDCVARNDTKEQELDGAVIIRWMVLQQPHTSPLALAGCSGTCAGQLCN